MTGHPSPKAKGIASVVESQHSLRCTQASPKPIRYWHFRTIDPEWKIGEKIARGSRAGWEDDRQPPGPMYKDRHHTGSKFRLFTGAGPKHPHIHSAVPCCAVVRPTKPCTVPAPNGAEGGGSLDGQGGRRRSLILKQWLKRWISGGDIYANTGAGAPFQGRTGTRQRSGSCCLLTRCACPPSPGDGYVPEWKPPTRVL